MQKSYSHRHLVPDRDTYPEIGRDIKRQQALAKYRRLKLLEKSQLTLDDEIFIENFRTAMRLWWNVQI